MPKKLPSSGYIQFGKQLDLFEEAVVDASIADPTLVGEAQERVEKQKQVVLDLFQKKGK